MRTTKRFIAKVLFAVVLFPTLSVSETYALAPSEKEATPSPVFYRKSISLHKPIIKLASGDFNGDGQLDFAGVEKSRAWLMIFYGKKNAPFVRRRFRLRHPTHDFKVADVNRDGKDDFLFLYGEPSVLRCFLSRRTGEIHPTGVLKTANNAKQLEVEFHETLYKIFAVGDKAGIETFSVDKKGVLKSQRLTFTAQPYKEIRHGHLHSDEVDEDYLLCASNDENKLLLVRDSENDVFNEPVAYAFQGAIHGMDTKDLNQNSIPDAILSLDESLNRGKKSHIQVIYDLGIETGVQPLTLPTGNNPGQILVSDVNGDARSDILYADSQEQTISIFWGEEKNTFSERTVWGCATRVSDFLAADFNRDGVREVVFCSADSKHLVFFTTDAALNPSEKRRRGRRRKNARPELKQIVCPPIPADLMPAHSGEPEDLFVLSNTLNYVSKVDLNRHHSRIFSRSLNETAQKAWRLSSQVLVCLLENKLTVQQYSSTFHLKKSNEMPIFSNHLQSAVLWKTRQANIPFVLTLFDKGNQSILPRMQHLGIDMRNPSITELVSENEMNLEKVQRFGTYECKKNTVLVMEKQLSLHMRSECFSVELNSSEKIRLQKKDIPKEGQAIQNALPGKLVSLADFDGDEKIDFAFVRKGRIYFYLSSALYRARLNPYLFGLSGDDFFKVDDLNQDGLPDFFVGKSRNSRLYFLQGQKGGNFFKPRTLLKNVAVQDLAIIKEKGERKLAVSNAKTSTVDILSLKAFRFLN